LWALLKFLAEISDNEKVYKILHTHDMFHDEITTLSLTKNFSVWELNQGDTR